MWGRQWRWKEGHSKHRRRVSVRTEVRELGMLGKLLRNSSISWKN